MDGYKLWYSGSKRHRNGVGILKDEEIRRNVVEVKRASDRLMTIKLVIAGFMLNVFSIYVLQIVIARDFNGNIGVLLGGYDDVHGVFGFGCRNGQEAALLDFPRAFRWDVDDMWDRATSYIKETARKVLFVLRGRAGQHQWDWWWNEEVKKKVEIKKGEYIRLIESKDEEKK
ncbi:uncharacterized protein LOC124898474 [Capsicum annuum]|uniref:uncharacterized protein LOC124898474 n=1 Tax=Capsicum annuum TaxID=4072 RepID=UPI001FB13CF7|nr:uncharacterized protein LOC124898474 [Capsicum annuum]